MKYNITKELFEAVMGESEYKKTLDCIIDDSILYHIPYSGNMEILINDFFFACKEWALEQGICLMTGVEEHTPSSWVYVCFQSNRYRPDPQNRLKNPLVEHKTQTPTMYGNNEKQCLFDACKWILDNKDKQ